MLILFCGLPGSGKTVLSKKLANKINSIYLNTDIVRKRLFETPAYTNEEKDKIYSRMLDMADFALKQGKDVVLDGTFYKDSLRKSAISIAKNNSEKYLIIECIAHEKTVKVWMQKRAKKKSVSDADFAVYERLKKEYYPIKEKHFIFKTDKTFSTQFNKLLAEIKKLKTKKNN